MSEDRVHHPYSPSQLQSLEVCPCYRGKDSKHERTIAGTIAHAVVETGKDDARLSDADAVAAASCLDFLEQRRQVIQAEFPEGPLQELREIYLPVDGLVFMDCEGTTAGYVDHVILNHDETYAEMSDWKFGYWQVEVAENNLQAKGYMLGLFRRFPKLKRIRFNFKLPNVDGFSKAEMTREDIAATYLRIQVIVARARKARQSGTYADAVPTSPLCNFCANLADCPAVAALMINIAKKFWPLSIPDDITPTTFLNTRDAGQCLRIVSTAKAWATASGGRILDRVLCGNADMPEGYHLQTSKGNRKIADPEKFVQVTTQYVPPEEYQKMTEPPAFGVVETYIKDNAPRGQKETTVKEYKQALEAAGATARGEAFSFLKATNDKEKAKHAAQD